MTTSVDGEGSRLFPSFKYLTINSAKLLSGLYFYYATSGLFPHFPSPNAISRKTKQKAFYLKNVGRWLKIKLICCRRSPILKLDKFGI